MTAADDLRGRISAAVQPISGVMLSADIAHLLVHWLGQHLEWAQQRYGCAPEGLAEAIYALAEACTSGDARQREDFEYGDAELLRLNRDTEITTAEAAALLGIRADLVRWHCRQGNLDSRKVGRQTMVTVASIESYKRRKAENNRSA